MPDAGFLKCNCDGTSRGNPDESSYAFSIRNSQGNLIWAEAQSIGVTTNNKTEATSILKCLRFCASTNFRSVVAEHTSKGMENSLGVVRFNDRGKRAS